MLCGRLTRARVTFKSDVIIILNLKRTMVLTVMRRRLSVYRVHLHVPRSVSDSLCYLESAWQGMHSSTAVSGGGVCWMIMPDNTSLLSMPARAILSFLPCGVVPLVLPFDTSACDALVFAVRCRATRACVCDAAVSLLRVPVHKACYDAGLLGRGVVGRTCRWGSP